MGVKEVPCFITCITSDLNKKLIVMHSLGVAGYGEPGFKGALCMFISTVHFDLLELCSWLFLLAALFSGAFSLASK